MASFDAVNYALRPSKTVQRQLIFEGVRRLKAILGATGIYVGFGSIWFTDFVLAHKLLGMEEMYSIEANDIGFARASYNKPYASVVVHHGISSEILPKMLGDSSLAAKQWVAWLDYDGYLNEDIRDDIRLMLEKLPSGSVLIVSFNAHEMSYGRGIERLPRLKTIFGDALPAETTANACKGDRLVGTLATAAVDLMRAIVHDAARREVFVPAFQIAYRDGAPMVTVGGVVTDQGTADRIAADIATQDWPCRPAKLIAAPHLTVREASALQALLPKSVKLTRADVRAIGFDLDDDQVEAFAKYYRQYPAYAQIVT